MSKKISKSLNDTAQIAKEWLSGACRTRLNLVAPEAYVVGLSGHLGAGKTAFVKCLAENLGIGGDITSPTFVIMKIYDIDAGVAEKNFGKDFPWRRLVHIDAYRLERQEELQALDFEDIVSDSHNLVLVEWPENVGIKDMYDNIKFEAEEGVDSRSIEY